MWSESELGAINPDQPRPKIDQQTGADATLRFLHDGQEIARFAPSPSPLAKLALRHLLRLTTALHPFIVEAIAATEHVPATLTYLRSSDQDLRRETLNLRSADEVVQDYPLPASFQAVPLPPGAPQALAELLPVMLDAVAGRMGTGPRTIASYDDAIREALSKGAKFQAMLLAMEKHLQHGDAVPGAMQFQYVFDKTRGDSRVEQLLYALDQAKDPKGRLKTLRGIDRSDLSNAYVLDDYIANDIGAAGDEQDPFPLFESAIRGNPYMAGYYKDLGDQFFGGYQMDLAWLCYDLARAVPGHERAPVPAAIDDLEQGLRRDNPAYF
jgi:hypothetical protein